MNEISRKIIFLLSYWIKINKLVVVKEVEKFFNDINKSFNDITEIS